MRILLVHNYYQQAGGEEQIFAAETALLRGAGHSISHYTLHNDQVGQTNPLALAAATVWNGTVYRELRALIRRDRPQVVHFHNAFPLISPAAYYAAKAEGVPVVQTCHNYRLICPNALFFRQGQVCEDCLGKPVPWPALVYHCYRGSRAASGVTVAMLSLHRALGTWANQIDRYIALTEFGRQKLIQGGLPASKIVVKPNFVPDAGVGRGTGGYLLFVGRLSPEKGIETLLEAWERLAGRIPLKIVGDGPLADRVQRASDRLPGVEWLGHRSLPEVFALMAEAAFLVFPSRWYEGLPRTILESFAVGTPVIAPNLGAMGSLITPGQTGFHFRAGDGADLADRVLQAMAQPEELPRLRQRTRAEFEAHYTAERNYQQLMAIYQDLLPQDGPDPTLSAPVRSSLTVGGKP